MRTALPLSMLGGLLAALSSLSAAAAVPASPTPSAAKQPSSPKVEMITAVGEGAMATSDEEPNRAKAYLQAKAYAHAQAVANLIQIARGTSVVYHATGKDYEMTERLSQEIGGMVEHVQTVSERKVQIGKDTVIQIKVQAPVPERWMKSAPRRSVAANAGAGPSWTVASVAPTIPAPKSFRKAKEQAYTSVIVDTLGMHVARAMSPKILRKTGDEVWGTVKVDYDFLADHGIVAYARTLGEAYSNARAGDNPLVLRAARRGSSPFRCDVVLSNDDADYLLSEDRRAGFLREFRVIFLVDGAD